MAVQISILIEGEDSKVSVNEVGSLEMNLIDFLNKWREVAEEPCQAGQKCKILARFLQELEGILSS